jgi:hypothetical protein
LKLIQVAGRVEPPFKVAVRVEVTGHDKLPPEVQALIAGVAILLASLTVPSGAVTVLGLDVLLTLIVEVTTVGGSQVSRLQLQIALTTITLKVASKPTFPA